MKFVYLFSSIIFLSSLFSCSNVKEHKSKSNYDFKSISKVIFQFHDASVPPDFHRSLTYTITPSQLNFMVDSYGEIVKDTTIKIDEGKWHHITQALQQCEISKANSVKQMESGCTGGTGNSMEVFFNDESSWNAHIYYCANEYEGDLLGDLPCFIESIKKDIDPKVFAHD